MKDQNKTKAQLIAELKGVRQRIYKLEKNEARWVHTNKALRECTERKRPEDALRESEGKFRSFTENPPKTVFTINRDGEILYMNHAPDGVDLDQVIGTNMYSLMDSDFHELVKEHVRAVFDEEKPSQYETRGISLKGRQPDYLSNIGPIFGDHGEVISAIISTQDISEYKRAVTEVEHTKILFQTIMDESNLVIFVKKAEDLSHVWLSKRFAETVGISRGEAQGKTNREIFGEKIGATFDATDREVLTGKRIEKEESPDGEHIYWSQKFPIKLPDGDTYLCGIATDITERMKTEVALKESEEQYRSLVEQSTDAIYVIQDEHYVLVNKAWENMFGYSRPEAYSPDFDYWKIIAEKSYPLVKERRISRSMGSLIKPRYEFFGLTKDNRTLHIETRVVDILWKGQPAIQGIYRDITELKKAEKSLRESEEKYKASFIDSRDAILVFSSDRKIIDVNRMFIELSGYLEIELKSVQLKELFPEVEGQNIDERIKSMLSGGKIPFFEAKLHAKNKINIPVDIGFTMLKNCYGQKIVFQANIRDITARKKTEEALRNALAEVENLKNRLQEENIYLRDEIKVQHQFGNIIGLSGSLKKVLRQVEQVAATDSNVLILGETGTGKELIARGIHEMSLRKERPLVKINCAALPANFIESELFGHEKGAFTGAIARRVGRFELAHKGTIFLDEIGDLPLDLQVKLLRVLQEGEFERLGSHKTSKVDVRVIAATNRNIEKQVQEGSFREDLFFRLNVFPINLPPLRDRREDIPLLAKHFIEKHNAKLGKQIDIIPAKAMNALQTYNWPGNIRELENIIERAMIISDGSKLEQIDWFLGQKSRIAKSGSPNTILEMEKQLILETLNRAMWRVSGWGGAAEILKMKPTTLEARMKKLGIKRFK